MQTPPAVVMAAAPGGGSGDLAARSGAPVARSTRRGCSESEEVAGTRMCRGTEVRRRWGGPAARLREVLGTTAMVVWPHGGLPPAVHAGRPWRRQEKDRRCGGGCLAGRPVRELCATASASSASLLRLLRLAASATEVEGRGMACGGAVAAPSQLGCRGCGPGVPSCVCAEGAWVIRA